MFNVVAILANRHCFCCQSLQKQKMTPSSVICPRFSSLFYVAASWVKWRRTNIANLHINHTVILPLTCLVSKNWTSSSPGGAWTEYFHEWFSRNARYDCKTCLACKPWNRCQIFLQNGCGLATMRDYPQRIVISLLAHVEGSSNPYLYIVLEIRGFK